MIKRALVSVTDKTGVVNFCRALVQEFGVELVSTGGTARTLAEAGLPVREIADFTGAPEMLDGRVKTLHPKVHGALLALRDNPAHQAIVAEQGIELIDLVCVNLYAFKETIAREGVTEAEAIENIDIGGPSMLRSAAKNFHSVTVVPDQRFYDLVLGELRAHEGETTLETRRMLATEVFARTSSYDGAIAAYLSEDERLNLSLKRIQSLRYGENPHQQAAFYRREDAAPGTLALTAQLHGKALSYNNLLDTDAAWAAVREFATAEGAACAIIKHANPCGFALRSSAVEAYEAAYAGDPVSAYGGIVALNTTVTAEVVEAIFTHKQFVEVIIAPDYEPQALELLNTKKNLRVLRTGAIPPAGGERELRSVSGGVLMQQNDTVSEDPATFTVPTKRLPTDEERASLLFAWKVCKSVKSNAIIICRDSALAGLGAGQPNRVDSARIAVGHAGELAQGAVAASDAFMPFADSLEVLAEAGVTAVIQPGGSIRDEEVIAAADAAGVALLFTGQRHFRH